MINKDFFTEDEKSTLEERYVIPCFRGYRAEYKSGGRNIVIDIAAFENEFEVMAMVKGGAEIFSMKTDIWFNAQDAFKAYKSRLPEDKFTLKAHYANLRDDLRMALESGRKAENLNPEDGGASNFDSVAIFLPRWNCAMVEQAAREAGTECRSRKYPGGKLYIFDPDTHGQGGARTRNAKAMAETLVNMGYDASVEYRMD